jgi:predicted CoA-binding protein
MDERMAKAIALKTWAVVGATDDPGKYGYKLARVLKDAGRTVYPIHPTLSAIDEMAVYPSLKSLPAVPDIIDMVVNPRIGIGVMREAAELGIKTVWLQPGTRSDEIRAFAEEHGIELIEDCVLVRIG